MGKLTHPLKPPSGGFFNGEKMALKGMAVIPQKQCDWNQSNSTAADFIRNKPTVPSAQVNCDWNASSGITQILNKPAMTIASISGLQAALDAKNPLITIAANISDSQTNAATDAPTNLNTVTTLLGSLTGQVNSTNAKQNDLATKYNDPATKFNTLLSHLEAQGLQSI